MPTPTKTVQPLLLGALTIGVALAIGLYIMTLSPQERWGALAAAAAFVVTFAVCLVVWRRFRP